MAYQYETEAYEPEFAEPIEDIEIDACSVCGALADTDETECLGLCRTMAAEVLFEAEDVEAAQEEFLSRTEAEAMLRWKWTY